MIVFEAIGTTWKIDIADRLSETERSGLERRIRERIDVFDAVYSRFRADSLVTRISKYAGTYTLPEDAAPMLALYRRMYEITNGLMTPLIGQVLSDAGYDADYSLKPKPLHTPPEWDAAIEYVPPTLMIKQPVLLDFGAAGKGYLIDIVGELIARSGVRTFSIDAGGDILQRSSEGAVLRVGLERPDDTTQAIGVTQVTNRSICGSAGNRRAWGEFHHIIDPSTLASPRHIAAVWVIAASTMLADALTTALYFVGPERLSEFEFEYLILRPDFSVERSPGFTAELFTA